MKKIVKDNKGYMLVEVIVASVIALVMAYFLIDITIKLVNKNNDYYIESVLLIDKNIITKEIMDDIVSKKLTGVNCTTINSCELTFDGETKKALTIDEVNNKTIISYGNYKKEISDKLSANGISLVTTNDSILTISIPMQTNYSKEDYGINVTVPYNEDMEIVYPVFDTDIIISDNGVFNDKFSVNSYLVEPSCTNATVTFDYEKLEFRVSNISTKGTAICSPKLTTKTKQYLNTYIKDTLTGTTQGNGQVVNENGYRYEGRNPNNYIKFNDELWRIIGVFDETSHGQTGEYLTKIIKNDSLGGYVWDKNYNNSNWSNTSLYKLLNTYYYSATNGQNSGYCYMYGESITGHCDYTANGINDYYREMIKNVTWHYTGGVADLTLDELYSSEQSGSTISGYVGLMRLSDYGYSVLASSCPRTINTNNVGGEFSSNSCAGQSWLYKLGGCEWTITMRNGYVMVYYISSYGSTTDINVHNRNSAVRPVVYLDSSVYIVDGTGTETAPYIIRK